MTDIVIIGAGPAAISAAITCARTGARVRVVGEPAAEAGEARAPLESVHGGIATLLAELGAEDALATASRATYDFAGWQGHHLDRRAFDRALQRHVTVTSGRVIDLIVDNDRVVGIELADGSRLPAAYVIDGSGRRRLAGKRMGLPERVLTEPLVVATGVTARTDVTTTQFVAEPDGWTWLAPEPDGTCTWTRLARKHPGDAARAADLRWRVFRPIVADGLLLVGDAAGILDPAAGQGILLALWSGIMAGQAVARALAQPALAAIALAHYDDWYVTQYLERAARLREHYARLGIAIV